MKDFHCPIEFYSAEPWNPRILESSRGDSDLVMIVMYQFICKITYDSWYSCHWLHAIVIFIVIWLVCQDLCLDLDGELGPLKLGDTGREIFISAITPQNITAPRARIESYIWMCIFLNQQIWINKFESTSPIYPQYHESIMKYSWISCPLGQRAVLPDNMSIMSWKHWFVRCKASVYDSTYTLEVSCLAGCDSNLVNATQAQCHNVTMCWICWALCFCYQITNCSSNCSNIQRHSSNLPGLLGKILEVGPLGDSMRYIGIWCCQQARREARQLLQTPRLLKPF